MRRLVLSLMMIMAAGSSGRAAGVLYNTYAAWGDVANAQHGHLYIYTGNYPSTDYYLYSATTPGTTINTLVQTQTGIGPYQPVTAYPNEDAPGGFGNRYFKLSSTQPMVWEVDENNTCHCGDAHGMVAAADNPQSYKGSIFMTYLRRDTDTALDGWTLPDFGDQLAVVSAASGPITASVSKWNGTAWVTVVAASPSIPAGGVWMWSPDQNATKTRGGTLAANAGHYRVDLTGGQGLLYKGNVFTPLTTTRGGPWNRDNALLIAPDLATGKKIGLDLLGALVRYNSAPQIIVSNEGAAGAVFDLKRFAATTPGAVDNDWPVDGDDPSGSWVNVVTGQAVAVGQRWTYTSPNDGFFRVVSTNGVSLTAIMGTTLTQSKYTGGDYVYAMDTQQAIGKNFDWWGHLENAAEPLEVHVVAPWAGTQVTVNATGNATQVQTTSGPDQGLKFNIFSSSSQDIHFTVTANQYVYVWFMSTTQGNIFGETFFSNPPMPQNLMVAEKSASLSTASLGDTVTYVLTARNIGQGIATGVWVWDTIAAGMTLQSAIPAPTVATPPLYGWDLTALAALSDASVTVVASIDTATNGEVKHNYALVKADGAPDALSPDAPVRVLIPGADLTKSVNVGTASPGDTVTYVLNYFNSAAAYPPTPKLDLEVRGGSMDATNINFVFRVTNYNGADVAIRDLKFCYWLDDVPSSVTYNNWYGGDTSPWIWGGPAFPPASQSLTPLAPTITRPDNRNAQIQVCWQSNDAAKLLPSGSSWLNINLALTNNSNNWSLAKMNLATGTNFSRRAGGEGAYTQDSHFCLYYQGNLVAEYTNASTPDPNTGCEPPNWVGVWDSTPSDITYLGSSPAAALSGPAPVLSWFDPCCMPGASRAYTWWGEVKAGTAGGTVINNRGNAQSGSITAISNLATVVVPIVGTFTNTPTPSPSFTLSPTPSATRTATPSITATPTPSTTVSATHTPTLTITPSATPSPTTTVTLTPPPTPTPLPTATATPEPLLLSPLPSSPSPGGPNGLYIAYRLSTDAEVNIRLFTVSGEKVRDLDPFPGRRGPNEQFWDGKNSAGAACGTGVFITHIVARSTRGEEMDLWGKVSIVR